jgi:hypothetical protein
MSIGNKYQALEDSHVGCLGCGTDKGLFQVAHRNVGNHYVVGYIFTCEECFPRLKDTELTWVPNPKDIPK